MQSPQPAHHERIAITGMALVNALGNSVTEVWENSQAMRSGLGPVRLLPDDPPAFINPQAFVPGRNTYCGAMGRIHIAISRQDVQLPPQDFRAMSASTRLTLLMAGKVIEESGLSTAGYDPQRIGVFVSQNSGESASTLWDLNLTLRGRRIAELAASVGQWKPEQQEDFYQRLTAGRVRPDESTMLCRLNCTAAGLVCQRYGFAGPSFSVGAACSSSMAALYTAYTLLQAGIIDAAVVGGGEEVYGPLYFAEFSALGALARPSEHITKPEDYSRPFDLHRNGFVLGEGAAMVVLEKRSLAHKRNVPVHGLLASMGNVTNNVGLVEPSAHFQAEAIRRSFAGLDYGPEMVDLVECHATATPQGDMAEAQSLVQCFGHKNRATVLSGYKGQVGHTTGASGMISLIHGLCAMRAGTYPGTLNCPNPDPALHLDKARLRVLAAPEVWPSPDAGIRRMQINTFGFGGSCFVAQVEEDNDRQPGHISSVSTAFQGDEHIVDGTRLITLPHQGQNWRLGATTPLWMQELAGLSNEPTQEELTSLSRRGLWLSPPDTAPNVAIMCCGQGSVWPGMGRALYDSFPVVRDAMDRVARAASWDILALMDESSQEKIILTRWQQPYLFLLEYAQASYLLSLGLKPKVMSGHSLGELIALCLAGVYTPETAWSIMDTRATFMAQVEADATHETGMMSVHCTPEVLEATLKEWPELHVSNYNSPMQVILSGPRALLLEVRKTLRKRRIPAVMLGVSMAFHHPHMRSLREASVARLELLDFHPATLPMMSNITTGLYPKEPAAIVQYIADLDENSVRWVECVRNMWNIYGVRDFVEMGPTDILCGLVSDIEPKARCVAASRKDREVEALRTAVARLYAMGHLSVRPGHGGQSGFSQAQRSGPAPDSAPHAKAPATPQATPQVEAHIEAVMPIIALATGYTREELQPDMDLRHDLAIRSSRFPLIMHEAEQQFHISLRFEDMLGVATIRDLADVLRRLQAKAAGSADSDEDDSRKTSVPQNGVSGPPANPDAQDPIPPLLRYAPRLHAVPMPEAEGQAPWTTLPADQLLLVGSGPCARLCAAQVGPLAPHTVIHPCATVQEALAYLKDNPLNSRRALVLALDNDRDAPQTPQSPQSPENSLTARLTDIFLLLQAFCKGKGASFCLCVQQGLSASPLLEGLNGLSLAAALEYPACLFRTACVGQEAPDSWLTQCLSPRGDSPQPHPVQWIFDQGHSYTPHLLPVALEPAPLPAIALPLCHGDIIVVPGGARGISPYALTALAPLGCTLVLLGRSPQSDSAPLEKLRALGATVQHKLCDVTDPASLRRTIGEIVAEFGRVDGLVYTAGTTRDATLDSLSAQDFHAVLAVKCQGLEQCLQATAPAGLRYAVAFSSVAAWLGNYGQTNYCAANRAMTALLHSFCRSRNIASRAVWLPPLDGDGMAAGADMREQMRLRSMDHAWIHCEELGELLARELFCGTEADIVWARILPAVPHVSLPATPDQRALVGLFERPERFPMVFPLQAAPLPEGLFTGGHHFSHYGDSWLKDAAPADSSQAAHRVPTAMLVECLVESALQNCLGLQSFAVYDLVLDAPLVCTGGITRESLFTSQSLPWETKSATLSRICTTSAHVYTLSTNGRHQRSLAPLCRGRIALAPAPSLCADRAEREALPPLQPLWDVEIPAPGPQQAVEAFYRSSGLGPHWHLLTDTNTVQSAHASGILASTSAWGKDVQAKLVFPAHTLEALLHAALMLHMRAGGSQTDRVHSIASIQFCTPLACLAGSLYLTVFPAPDHNPADGCFDGQVHDEHGTVRMRVRTISFAAHTASSGKTLFNLVEN